MRADALQARPADLRVRPAPRAQPQPPSAYRSATAAQCRHCTVLSLACRRGMLHAMGRAACRIRGARVPATWHASMRRTRRHYPTRQRPPQLPNLLRVLTPPASSPISPTRPPWAPLRAPLTTYRHSSVMRNALALATTVPKRRPPRMRRRRRTGQLPLKQRRRKQTRSAAGVRQTLGSFDGPTSSGATTERPTL